MTVDINTGYTGELLGYIRKQFRDVILLMLIGVPEAARQFSRGNAVTAFKLLEEASNIKVHLGRGYTKEMVLKMAFGDLPTDFRTADIDPD